MAPKSRENVNSDIESSDDEGIKNMYVTEENTFHTNISDLLAHKDPVVLLTKL
jgi:hypothetical protein